MGAHGDGPLQGERIIGGPAATMLLADLGAEVIKIEDFGGDPARNLKTSAADAERPGATYLGYNRGKRSIALDLKTPDGSKVARELVGTGNIVVESFRPGVMDSLGLGAGELQREQPELIYGSLAGFGFEGPERDRRGVDLVIQAESGLMSVTGYADGPPTKVGFTVVDAAAGYAFAHALLGAVIQRDRTGQGDYVRSSLYDVALHLQLGPFGEYLQTGVTPGRSGNSAPTTAPADMFRASDGYLVISAYLPHHWTALCQALGRDDLLEDERFADQMHRVRNRAELLPELEAVLSTQPRDHWVRELQGVGLVVGAVKSYDQVENSTQFESSDLALDVGDSSDRGYRTLRSPYTMAGGSAPAATPAPDVGEHTQEILAELGYSTGDIQALLEAGAARSATAPSRVG